MNPLPPPAASQRSRLVLAGLVVAFGALAAGFLAHLWGRPSPVAVIPPVDRKFLDPAPVRRSHADLVAAKEDLSDFDCYACHEKNKAPPIRFDANQRILVPKEHADVVMAHGAHDRNNHCFNCHQDTNLLALQARDGRPLTFDQAPQLCGSCHGAAYRDWEGGSHGRTSGFWNAAAGPGQRLSCVNCHDPHSPRFPGREPAPGPHALRAAASHGAVPAAAGKPAP